MQAKDALLAWEGTPRTFGEEAMKNIVLIGMPAAGKSTVGVVAAKRLGYDFIDPDLLIQQKEGKLLCQIIEEKGAEGFLEVENRVNVSVDAEKAVIAPGGSVVYCAEAMEHYKRTGVIVYLQASYETIEERLCNVEGRGVVFRGRQTLRDIYEERRVLFEKYADITVCEDGKSLEETLDCVVETFGAFSHGIPSEWASPADNN